MTDELKPELESLEKVIVSALSCLPPRRRSNQNAVRRMIQFSKGHTVKLPLGETVEQLVRQSHRY